MVNLRDIRFKFAHFLFDHKGEKVEKHLMKNFFFIVVMKYKMVEKVEKGPLYIFWT